MTQPKTVFNMRFNDSTSAGFTRRQTLLGALGAAGLSAAGLSACGGGGDGASLGSAVPGSFSVDPITGIGSIIVNGIRYDDSSASISSDDSAFRREDLRLGMVVAVQGTPSVGGRSSATRIVLGGELVGPIGSKGADSLVVLGQTVTIGDSTVFASGGGLDALNSGDVVEVHGITDLANNTLRATYVEKKSSPSEYRIQGRVTTHDATARTFSIGSLQLNYASTDPDRVRITPAADSLVRVRLGTTAVSSAYPVNRIRKPEDALNAFNGEVELKGTITAFTSHTSFSVNDVPVIVSGVSMATYPEGTGRIEGGAYVEVKGSLVDGVLVATRVKLEDGVQPGGVGDEFELHGTISNAATSGSGGSFTLTSSSGVSVLVDWPGNVLFPDGSAVNLVNGSRVEVKGLLVNGNQVAATRISFEN
ncbi:MAG: DUF5666 domain-containing protein [Hydrogenophaga sp.]|uniref:DUF5666 domain-containing protein n=1 Tax=Hydrogenophaga sp. TaxID=1904254 RepID=UPI00260B9DFE|nr:DUF5666 domain-containing protein [Hydrogenophaga sp.]MDM7942369.1 DUF5666 domain-containing protein [Hydrogenophaga sp.]